MAATANAIPEAREPRLVVSTRLHRRTSPVTLALTHPKHKRTKKDMLIAPKRAASPATNIKRGRNPQRMKLAKQATPHQFGAGERLSFLNISSPRTERYSETPIDIPSAIKDDDPTTATTLVDAERKDEPATIASDVMTPSTPPNKALRRYRAIQIFHVV